jgi:hypothetical protein
MVLILVIISESTELGSLAFFFSSSYKFLQSRHIPVHRIIKRNKKTLFRDYVNKNHIHLMYRHVFSHLTAPPPFYFLHFHHFSWKPDKQMLDFLAPTNLKDTWNLVSSKIEIKFISTQLTF